MEHLGLAFGMVTCMQSDATMLDPLQRLILHGRIATGVSSSGSGHSDRRSTGLSSKHHCTVVTFTGLHVELFVHLIIIVLVGLLVPVNLLVVCSMVSCKQK